VQNHPGKDHGVRLLLSLEAFYTYREWRCELRLLLAHYGTQRAIQVSKVDEGMSELCRDFWVSFLRNRTDASIERSVESDGGYHPGAQEQRIDSLISRPILLLFPNRGARRLG